MFPGAPAYVGYCMAAASFFAFANALQRGAHIRVAMLLNVVGDGPRRLLETWCFGIGAVLAWYFVYHATKFVYWSWKFHEISQDQDATLMWIPQSSMVIGSVILAIALTDCFLHMLLSGRNRIEAEVVDGQGD